jgi:hypothetical protein
LPPVGGDWPGPGVGGDWGAAEEVAAAGSGACFGASAGVPAGSIVPTVAPTSTVSPSATVIFSTPSAGAGTSVLALSVSTSKSGSPDLIREPSGFIQRDRIPSVTDSPALGTLISTAAISG